MPLTVTLRNMEIECGGKTVGLTQSKSSRDGNPKNTITKETGSVRNSKVNGPHGKPARFPTRLFYESEKCGSDWILMGNKSYPKENMDRAVSCVNACAGIVDPEKTIPELVAALTKLVDDYNVLALDNPFNQDKFLAASLDILGKLNGSK